MPSLLFCFTLSLLFWPCCLKISVIFCTMTGNGNDLSDLTSSIITLCSWLRRDFFRFSPQTLPMAVMNCILWCCAMGLSMSVTHFFIVTGWPSIQVYCCCCCCCCCNWLAPSNKMVKPLEPFELSKKLHLCHT